MTFVRLNVHDKPADMASETRPLLVPSQPLPQVQAQAQTQSSPALQVAVQQQLHTQTQIQTLPQAQLQLQLQPATQLDSVEVQTMEKRTSLKSKLKSPAVHKPIAKKVRLQDPPTVPQAVATNAPVRGEPPLRPSRPIEVELGVKAGPGAGSAAQPVIVPTPTTNVEPVSMPVPAPEAVPNSQAPEMAKRVESVLAESSLPLSHEELQKANRNAVLGVAQYLLHIFHRGHHQPIPIIRQSLMSGNEEGLWAALVAGSATLTEGQNKVLRSLLRHPLEQPETTMVSIYLLKELTSPHEGLYQKLDKLGIYLPRKNMCTIDFLNALLSGEKLFFKREDVRPVSPPQIAEFAVSRYCQYYSDPACFRYLPVGLGIGRPPNRDFLFTIINTVYPGLIQRHMDQVAASHRKQEPCVPLRTLFASLLLPAEAASLQVKIPIKRNIKKGKRGRPKSKTAKDPATTQ